jgi:phi LC3 family holin
MKINWQVRFKNPVFWAQVALSVLVPVLAYFGIEAKDLTTWAALFSLIARAFANPYVVVMMVISLWNAVNDPTTNSVSDSALALTYSKPKEDK